LFVARSAQVPVYSDDAGPMGPADDGTATPQRRRSGGWRDMVYSLLALLVPILIAFGAWQYLNSDRQVNTVDPSESIAEAHQSARFTVITPHGLPDGWKTTSADTTLSGKTVTLRLGYVTPSGGFAQLVESDRDSAALLAGSVPRDARPAGTERIAGAPWSKYTGEKNHAVLALLRPHRTILVVGQTSDTEMRALAASLR
jgi:uncharacterized protein DUF4245